MKKLMAIAAVLSLASASNFALPTVASAGSGNGNVTVAQACQAFFDTYLGVNQGNCIQILNAVIGGVPITNANAVCHYWEGPQPTVQLGPFPFATFGQCVSILNAAFGKS